MLVLSRKLGEETVLAFQLGTSEEILVRVEVVQINRGQIRLGFTAPTSVQILRAELFEEGEGHVELD